MRVLIPLPIHASGVNYLKEHGYTVEMGTKTDSESMKRLIKDADAAIIKGTVIDEEILQAGVPRLKVIARHGIGVDNVDVAAAEKLGIWMTITPKASIRSVAEHTIGLMLSIAKHMRQGDMYMREGRWLDFRKNFIGVELGKSVLGLIGVGRIGNEVAKIAIDGFGMRVLAYDPYARPESIYHRVTVAGSLDEVLSKSDFVSLHFPLTKNNYESINRDFFGKMNPNAFLINTARGELIKDEDLVWALENGIIRGAALDVFHNEPIGSDHPFCKLSNVLLSPHFATITETTQEQLAIDSAISVHEVLSGMKPSWPVNEPGKKINSYKEQV